MYQTLPQFYNSKEWKEFRKSLIDERTNRSDGVLYSEFSGKPLIKDYDIVLHHIKPLTTQNVNDFEVSMNPENIMILSQKEHNEIHKRFGYCTERKVYVVYGSPCSGKNTFVNSVKGNSDIVVDIDLIWQCITGGELYQKPNALKINAFGIRDCLIDMIKTRSGKWEKAYIITGGARKGERERFIEALGAEGIFISTDKKTCLERLASDNKRNFDEWQRYINEWFADYQE